jgi:CHAT domain-containing protein
MKQRIFLKGVLSGVPFLFLLSSMPALLYARNPPDGPRLNHRRVVQEPSAIPQSSPIPLEPDRSLPLRLNATQSQTLTVNLPAGFYGQVVFEWGGIDLEVMVRGPDGSAVFPMSIPVRGFGSLPISLSAEVAGLYSLEVRAVDQLNYVGHYSVILKNVRAVTPIDKANVEATRATIDALQQKTRPLTIEGLLNALKLWNSVEEGSGKAFTLQRLGSTYLSNKEPALAETHYNQALEIRKRVGSSRAVVYTLRDIGADYRAFGSPTKAIEYYDIALAMARDAKDRRAESDLLYSIAFAHARIGHLQIAIGFYEQARVIQQAEKDELSEARTLNSMGGAYDALGQKTQAMSLYQQASDRFAKLGDRYRQFIGVNNIGVIYDDWGDYQTAREKYDAALAGFKDLLPDPATSCRFGASARTQSLCIALASTMDNIGELSNTLGDPDGALVKFRESKAITELLNQPQPTGVTLSRICYSHLLLGKPEEALGFCQSALKLNEQARDLRGSASTLTFLGMANAALNNNANAINHFERALAQQKEAGDRRGQGVTLDKIGLLYAADLKWDQAIAHFSQALQLWRDISDPDGQAITLYDWAKTERDRGNYDSALKLVYEALAIVESTRARLRSRRQLSYYFAGKQNYYELKIDTEMRRAAERDSREHVIAAFETREQANARNLLTALNEARFLRSEMIGNNDPQLKELLQRQQTLGQNLNSKENARRELLSAKHEEASRTAINKAIDELVDEYDRIEVKIRALNPRIAELKDPHPATLPQIQREFDPDTLLLQYSLGDKRSYLWAVTNETIHAFELAPREQIESVATRLLYAITARNRDEANETSRQRVTRWANADKEYVDAAAALSKLILEPVASLLGQKRLVIVADGALQLIPFAVLPEPATLAAPTPSTPTPSMLIAKREIVSLPSASVLALQRRELASRKSAPLSVAVLADPVFQRRDQRVADAIAAAKKRSKRSGKQAPSVNGSPDVTALPNNPHSSVAKALRSVGLDPNSALQRLVMSRVEATEITRVASDRFLKALDFEANRATALSGELSKYRYVHFATHGVVDLERPELSGIALSMVDEKGKEQDGYLRLYEIYNLNLPAELVVLSACQTGVGKQVKGEGLMALTRGFMHAGAARVVASHWKVDDSATAALMAQFYKEMFVNSKRPAAALRDAQVAISQQKQWQSPYFWAGFVLHGEWR